MLVAAVVPVARLVVVVDIVPVYHQVLAAAVAGLVLVVAEHVVDTLQSFFAADNCPDLLVVRVVDPGLVAVLAVLLGAAVVVAAALVALDVAAAVAVDSLLLLPIGFVGEAGIAGIVLGAEREDYFVVAEADHTAVDSHLVAVAEDIALVAVVVLLKYKPVVEVPHYFQTAPPRLNELIPIMLQIRK